MDFKNLLPAKNRDELRQRLLENYNKEDECWGVCGSGRHVREQEMGKCRQHYSV